MFLSSSTPVARKDHQCQWCFGTIKKGHPYHNSRNVLDGSAYTFKAHEGCLRLADALKYTHRFAEALAAIQPKATK